MSVDTVVVGAGLPGLAAARDLQRGGAEVLVLEARDRVAQTQLLDGRLVQLGGGVPGPGHTARAQLVTELGLTLAGVHVRGRRGHVGAGRRGGHWRARQLDRFSVGHWLRVEAPLRRWSAP
ncbi:MAG TPA: FAD-dependent oxidoreductase [Nocardioidaceae bacterium]|nr:FAD-dependent oxidoreductase [Nocardioidaceae bacterium]